MVLGLTFMRLHATLAEMYMILGLLVCDLLSCRETGVGLWWTGVRLAVTGVNCRGLA